ncbi:MAG: serine hydrolase [Verrucomicrobia bacterium]|nr:serine hydrolase [Verrucomicrobiota bacterium]
MNPLSSTLRWLTLVLFPITQSFAQPNSPANTFTAAIAAAESFIAHELADKQLPALSVALIDDQRIVWAKGFGFADPTNRVPASAETIHRVGSVSKLFTDIAVMQLVEQGKLDLDAPITRYLPEFQPRNPFGKPITLRQLMSHRAGLVREPPVGNYFDPTEPSLGQTIASLNSTELVYAPESRTKYSNAGIAVVGCVLERLSGKPFAAYLKEAVLAPLGMSDSSFEPTPAITSRLARAYMWTVDGRTFEAPRFQLGISPAGSMYTTVNDLGRFVSALFADGQGSGGRVLQKATLEQMWTPQFAAPGTKTGFGIGFNVSEFEGQRYVGHNGAIYGFATHLAALPEQKLGAVVVTTMDFANIVAKRVADFALQSMLAARDGHELPKPVLPTPIADDTVRRLAGKYQRGQQTIELSARAGKLFLFDYDSRFESELRALSDELIADDRISFGAKFKFTDGHFWIGTNDFVRHLDLFDKPPLPPPRRWEGLIGEYGWDHDTLFIFEKAGQLWALIEWFEFNPLEEVSADVFKFPNRGLYHGEQLIFKRERNGRAIEVEAASVAFKRRNIEPAAGTTQMRVKPLRPVAELLREARRAEPPKENGDFRPTDLVEITSLDSSIKLEVRYATKNNFLSSKFYAQARAFAQRPVAEALLRVQAKLRAQGFGLLIYDAYRPWFVTKTFWDATPSAQKWLVADPSKGSRHNRGAAVDLTLCDLKTGRTVPMVSTYDETTARARPDYPGGSSVERWHRQLLRDMMEAEGFTVYPEEWWHFDFNGWEKYAIGNAPFDKLDSTKRK